MEQRTLPRVALAASLAAALGLMGCDLVVAAPSQSPALDSLQLSDTVGLADGVTLDTVVAYVDSTLPASARSVTINTTLGTFAFGGKQTVTLNPDSRGYARTYLRAPRDPGVALVWATADSTARKVSVTRTITYAPAAVAAITLTPDSLYVAAGPEHFVRVTARLLSSVGRPSPQARVVFSALGTDSLPHGQFTSALPSDTSDQVVVMFTSFGLPPDTTYRGRLALTATSQANPSVKGTVTIVVR